MKIEAKKLQPKKQSNSAKTESKKEKDGENELPTNIETLQTKSSMKTMVKGKSMHIEEIMSEKEGDKLAEELSKSAEKAAKGSLDNHGPSREEEGQGRASIAQVVAGDNDKITEETQDIISTHVESIEDLFGKSDKQALNDAMKTAKPKVTKTVA